MPSKPVDPVALKEAIFWGRYNRAVANITRGRYLRSDIHTVVESTAKTRRKFPLLVIGRAAGAPQVDEHAF